MVRTFISTAIVRFCYEWGWRLLAYAGYAACGELASIKYGGRNDFDQRSSEWANLPGYPKVRIGEIKSQ
jgi:hypothetical protein